MHFLVQKPTPGKGAGAPAAARGRSFSAYKYVVNFFLVQLLTVHVLYTHFLVQTEWLVRPEKVLEHRRRREVELLKAEMEEVTARQVSSPPARQYHPRKTLDSLSLSLSIYIYR